MYAHTSQVVAQKQHRVPALFVSVIMNEKEIKDVEVAGSADEDSIFIGVDKDDIDPNDFSNVPASVMHRWLSIFIQLASHHRFTEWFQQNYVIQDKVNASEKTIETLIIESPISVGPPLSSTQLYEMQNLLKIVGCSDPDKTFKTLLTLLGQEGPVIELSK